MGRSARIEQAIDSGKSAGENISGFGNDSATRLLQATHVMIARQSVVRLGLDPDKPTAIVLFGGKVQVNAHDRARVTGSTARLQMIVICGRNRQTSESDDRPVPRAYPHTSWGSRAEIPYYMSLSDFFIGKPGPGSISEAVAMKLPVIVQRNAWTCRRKDTTRIGSGKKTSA